MSAEAEPRWRIGGVPLAIQIIALLLAGLVVAQVSTLALTVLLPPKPPPKYRMVEVARALQGGPLKVSNPRPLIRVVRSQPPSLESPNWVVSEQSRADLARTLGVPSTNVRILFYSPLPLTHGGPGTSLASASAPGGQPRLVQASLLGVVDLMAGPGGMGPPAGGGFPGAGFPAGGFPGGGFPGGSPSSPSFPSSTSGSHTSRPSQANNPQTYGPQTSSAHTSQPAPAATVEPPSGAMPTAGADARSQPPPGGIAAPSTPVAPLAQPSSVERPFQGASVDGGPLYRGGMSTSSPSRSLTPSPEAARPTPHSLPSQPRPANLSEPGPPGALAEAAPETAPLASESEAPPSSPGADQTAARDQPSQFVLSRADRGGYVLPPEGAPIRGLFGPPPSPFLQGDFVAALQASPGRWVTVQPAPEPFPNSWQKRILLWFLLSSAAVAPIGLIFARRLAAPLARFADAAERLGRDPSGQQAPLDGPAEIGRAAKAFNEMQARLKRYIDDRTAMVGAISHDLRTPLARMRFRLERIPPQFRDGMVHDIGQMEEMITAVLAFIRDASELSVRERVELRSILECVVDNAALMGGDVSLDPGERVPVKVDSLSVERVLTNLIDNALKYGDRAHVRVFQDGADVVAEVEDEGPGLPDEELERVFLPFYRSDHSRSLNKSGIGLGLSVSRSIARAHGGDITLSRGQHGLKAQLRLPRAPLAA